MSKFQSDFNDFAGENSSTPSSTLDNVILDKVKHELEPSHIIVFAKILGIQVFVGLITMLFCPQFSLSLTNNYDLFHYLHHNFGAQVCSAICGAIFIGSGAIFATHLLNYNEVLKIKKSKILYYLSLTSVILAGFIFISSDVYFNLAVFWFAGAVLAGAGLLELNLHIKRRIIQSM